MIERDRQRPKESVDDFMADLFNTQKRQETPLTKSHTPKQAPPPSASRQSLPSKRRIAPLLIIGVFIVLAVGLCFIWKGPLSSLTGPRNPFSQEVQENMGIPLYYPGKLPDRLKMDVSSITQPEKNVVMYQISDDQNKRVHITLQTKPDGLNLDPVYAALQDVQEVHTKFGTLKVGTTEGDILMANILTDKTWIIVNGDSSALNTDLLIKIIDELRPTPQNGSSE